MAEDGLMEQLTGFLGSEEGIRQLRNAARMLGLQGEHPEEPHASPATQATSALPGMEGMDPQMMLKMAKMLQAARQETPSSAFLRALKPLLREERRGRVDEAIRMVQLFSLLPLLKEMG